MKRRAFLGMAAAVPAMAYPMDMSSVKSRGTKKVEIAYKSAHMSPNGLQATSEGMWQLDESRENWVSLVTVADGKVIREFQAVGAVGPSGLTVDGDNVMWINSSDSSQIFACDHKAGKVLRKYWSPGAGRTYKVKGDPAPSVSPLPFAFPRPVAANKGDGKKGGRGPALPYGQQRMDEMSGVGGLGGQGMEARGGLLYSSTMASRRLYVIEPKEWVITAMWDLPGNRSHGVGWEGDSLWIADTNFKAFFRMDVKNGKIFEKIQLGEKDPVPHGVTITDGRLWFCDVQGYICNFKL